MGTGICSVLGSYIVVAVLPRWGELGAHVRAAGLLSWPQVGAGYAVMLLSAIAHSVTYFQLLGNSGAVATGIMQAARAVGVFAASALLFCTGGAAATAAAVAAAGKGAATWQHTAQCFTAARGVATFLVVIGIIVYSQGKAAKGAGGKAAAHGVSVSDAKR